MKPRVLVTDDAAIIRQLIVDTVTEAGWQVVDQATNGQEAVEKYLQHRPDIMTLDLVMPEYDGRHALKHILAADPQARIVVVSALNQAEILREAISLGAAEFVVKPFDPPVLLETLRRVLQMEPTAPPVGS